MSQTPDSPATPTAAPTTTPSMSGLEYESLAAIVRDRSGIELTAHRRSGVTEALGRYLVGIGLDTFDQYLTLLTTGPIQHEEFQSLLSRISQSHEKFFDHPTQLRAFELTLLPELIETNKESRHLRIFCPACGRGQNAYSIAMVIHRAMGVRLMDWCVEIFGCDLNRTSIDLASRAVYDAADMEGVPEIMRLRYFRQHKGQWALNDDITQMVGFEALDLRDRAGIGRHGSWDAIVCRDTLAAFDEDTQRGVLGFFHDLLTDHGVLLVGESEILPPGLARLAPLPDRSLSGYRKG